MKYIIVEDASGVATPILFPANLTHRQVAAGLGVEHPGRVIEEYVRSQGDFSLYQTDGGSVCISRIASLNPGEDAILIERMFNGTTL